MDEAWHICVWNMWRSSGERRSTVSCADRTFEKISTLISVWWAFVYGVVLAVSRSFSISMFEYFACTLGNEKHFAVDLKLKFVSGAAKVLEQKPGEYTKLDGANTGKITKTGC